jgi:hypothetical protein
MPKYEQASGQRRVPDDVRRRQPRTIPPLSTIAVGRHPQGSRGETFLDSCGWRLPNVLANLRLVQRSTTCHLGKTAGGPGYGCKSAQEGRAGVIVIGQAFIILV